ncbi:hypothetical protein OO013_05535 [Mangrovivirga sp. M17]|uniref:Uncharacterized protein n=1 Tax=Mangrovivirga halotolerans TaxID=2993936 RepID=A0ABT3RPB1_9BACT|nr:DUF6624 domain-containing protein [Mangrovivirga halotolerans]MCX2743316.1 hypothetical protein [Mangrovivirga halotolerans]
MKHNFIILLALLFISQGCTNTEKKKNTETIETQFNQELANELDKLADVDQTAANVPRGKFKDYSKEEFNAYKDSVFTANKKRAEEILDEYGYPGIDLVGEEGSSNFWLIVQHCDFDPEFQKRVLKLMKAELDKGNANGKNYAYLTDRVRKNTGQKLLYGTQVVYNNQGQAVSMPLEDSANVNVRRAEVGLPPLEAYLNSMTKFHFQINKEMMLKRGIEEPILYEVPGQNDSIQ